MRSKTLVTLLALGLVSGLAVTALAQGAGGSPPSTGPGSQTTHESNRTATAGNATARQEAAQERHAELVAARQAVLHNFTANRTAILDAYHASLNATRAAFLDAKSKVLDGCSQARSNFTNNSGEKSPPDFAKCVHDGLQPLIEKARADNAAARQTALDALKGERAKGLSEWAKGLRAANEHYQARAGEPAPGA